MRNWKSKISKFVKRGAKRVGRVVKKRYGTFAKPKIGNIVKDVSMLKKMINAEKKRYTSASASTVPIGQVSGNTSAQIVQDITPIPAEGVTYQTRTGASIKMSSCLLRFQFVQQANRITTGKFKIQVVLVKGSPQTTTTFQSQYWLANPFLGGTIYDYNSNRNPDYFGQYKVLKTKYFSIKDDSVSADNIIRDIQIPMKLNHHIRFDKDTTTVVNGQLMLVITCDAGNCSTTTASTVTNAPLTAVNTGYNFLFSHVFYYFDN